MPLSPVGSMPAAIRARPMCVLLHSDSRQAADRVHLWERPTAHPHRGHRNGTSGMAADHIFRHGMAVSSGQLRISEGPDLDVAGERVALGTEAFALLDLPVPPDFGAAGSRRQILVDAGDGFVAYTVAAASGNGEVVRMS